MIEIRKEYIYWSYYLSIEDDLKIISKYIDINEANFNCFSVELSKLLQITCSEVDIVLKNICKILEPKNKENSNITDYMNIINEYLPEIAREKVYSKKIGIINMTPFENWEKSKSPDWWKGNNSIKHSRNTKFSEANLKNVLNAIAGLRLIISYFYLLEENNGYIRNQDGEINKIKFKNLHINISRKSFDASIFTLDKNYFIEEIKGLYQPTSEPGTIIFVNEDYKIPDS